MSDQTIIILAVLIAGVSTGVGALPIFFKKEFSRRFIDASLGFSAGVMLAASFLSLIIPGIEIASEQTSQSFYAVSLVISGLLLGHWALFFIHDKIPHDHIYKSEEYIEKKNLPSAFLIVIAIALHNLPEGMAVGVGFGGEDINQGLVVALAITIQNLPEGLVVALAFVAHGHSRFKAFLFAFLAGMIEPVGALIGFMITQVASFALPMSLGFAAGAMLFVVGHEIIPETHKEGHEREATHGLIIGIAVLCFIEFLIG